MPPHFEGFGPCHSHRRTRRVEDSRVLEMHSQERRSSYGARGEAVLTLLLLGYYRICPLPARTIVFIRFPSCYLPFQ